MGHRVRLRLDQFESRAQDLGLDSKISQARAIGVHHSIHSRVLRSKRELSAAYVLGVLRLFGDDHLRQQVESLFEVTEEPAKAAS